MFPAFAFSPCDVTHARRSRFRLDDSKEATLRPSASVTTVAMPYPGWPVLRIVLQMVEPVAMVMDVIGISFILSGCWLFRGLVRPGITGDRVSPVSSSVETGDAFSFRQFAGDGLDRDAQADFPPHFNADLVRVKRDPSAHKRAFPTLG